MTLPATAWAALGVLAFSFTFPATVLALRGFDPYVVGAGRSVVAALIAAGCLLAVRAPLPDRVDLPALIAVAGGCGIGFGLLSALALGHTTSTHAAVIIGLLPAATAVVAVLRLGERPRWPFWLASALGTCAVLAFALSRGTGGLHAADLLLLAALAVAAVGYAEGGRLARKMPGWQVIAWGLLLSLPVSLPVTLVALAHETPHPTAAAIVGMAYVSLFSMFLGFLAWYRGLAGAGVAKASQIQLAQPMLTIAWSVPVLGESAGAPAVLTGVVVAACVLVTQRTRGRPTPDRELERRQVDRPPSRSPSAADPEQREQLPPDRVGAGRRDGHRKAGR